MWHTNSNWWWGPGCFMGGPVGMILGILFWLLIAYGVVRLISKLARDNEKAPHQENSPLDILKRRLAQGEIDLEEFKQRKMEIES